MCVWFPIFPAQFIENGQKINGKELNFTSYLGNAITYEINIWMKGENKIDEGNLRLSSTRQSIWHDSLCGRGKKIAMIGK